MTLGLISSLLLISFLLPAFFGGKYCRSALLADFHGGDEFLILL